MPEASFPDYRLSGRVLQAWLRRRFKDDTIIVEKRAKRCLKRQSKDAEYVFTLPDGKELTDVRFTWVGSGILS
ncbi:unnamed protein product [Fusarium fujikuroi]|uniref:Uncharacterized protein n=1 Tax=Fusarium fujikuroi TaxID=5127 RepID=A0A9Q9UJ68_FUSFU|nr:unnamed protein product [Fusarium fujikuroi]VTT83972.1 unnamed protein product [Fusarium fujikuroi]VZH95167.1 unnamed protein product [Fusarium fujikuroi]